MTYLEMGWISEPLKAYAAHRLSMIDALKRFAGADPDENRLP
ncbi:hypothetical protein [Mycolicibacterium mengxianglii]|nr:hypothetical protein [Mycolicibacterium mengxianglii]